MTTDVNTHFQKLLQLSRTHEAAAPFVPYAGDIYTLNMAASRFPRVMWCGSATAGWGAGKLPNSYSDAMLMTRYFLLHELPDKKAGFWHSIFQFSQCLDERLHLEMGAHLFSRSGVLWNNLFKVGSVSGEAEDKRLRTSQIEICRDMFLNEVEDHKPEYVVLHVGSLADDMIEAVIGSANDGWENVSPSVWRRDEFGIPFFWVDRKYDKIQGQRGTQVADLVLSDFGRT